MHVAVYINYDQHAISIKEMDIYIQELIHN